MSLEQTVILGYKQLYWAMLVWNIFSISMFGYN